MVAANASMRAMWALGDYHRFATATVWGLGPVLVNACGVSAGQRVLDVAAGTGNVAIRAAQAGASVVASDVTPEHFDAGRRAAHEAGVDLEWVEGDAEALPFGDAEFDVLTSCFGAMFAPNHQATASELLRVCRPGGVIGMINFTPEGAGGDFFRVLGPYAPPSPAGALSPLLWGTEDAAIGLTAVNLCAAFVAPAVDYRLVELPGVSHWVADELPQTVAAAILSRVGDLG